MQDITGDTCFHAPLFVTVHNLLKIVMHKRRPQNLKSLGQESRSGKSEQSKNKHFIKYDIIVAGVGVRCYNNPMSLYYIVWRV